MAARALGRVGSFALRHALITFGSRDEVRRLAMGLPATRAFARRFVAGETRADALTVVRQLAGRGVAATVDFLGENVRERAQAEATAAEYGRLLDVLPPRGWGEAVSIKLTAFGLDVGEELCFGLVNELLAKAAARGQFVRIDMEGSAYTARTLDLYWRLHERHENVGVVLQAYLRRTAGDVEEMIRRGGRVRLCKGAYDEPASIAYESKDEVDESYARAMERLLVAGDRPALATHDDRLIRRALRFARENGVGQDRFELQMLYGIRRDMQAELARRGYCVRVYVPYGTHWYPYFLRRLAERAANLLFFLRGAAGR